MAEIATLLDELAAHVAAAAGLNHAAVPEGEQRELYVHRMDRRDAAATASVLRLAGGPADAYLPTVVVTVQCLTQAADEAEALARAWAIRDVFRDGDGLPARGVELTTWRLVRVDLAGQPAALGALPDGAVDVAFNWTIEAVPLPA